MQHGHFLLNLGSQKRAQLLLANVYGSARYNPVEQA
jgi:hypothetical protein